MKNKHLNQTIPAVFLAILLYQPEILAKESFSFSTGVTYLTGDYGSEEATDIYFVPFSFKYKNSNFSLKLTIPYLEKTGPSHIINDIGQTGQQITTVRTTESGLGNISATAKYNVFYHPAHQLLIDLAGSVNIGTASESKGLGTGKTDYGIQLGVYKVINKLTPFAKIGFKVYGSRQLNDVFSLSSGFSYKIIDEVSAGLNYSWREQVSISGTDKHQLTGFSSQKLNKNWSLQEYIFKGFGRSTADWGGGLSISYRY